MVLAVSHRVSPAPRYSGYSPQRLAYVYRAFTFYGIAFQRLSASRIFDYVCPTTPQLPKHLRFGLLPVRSPLLGEYLNWSIFLPVLRCFSSRGSLLACARFPHCCGRVAPFGNPRIEGCLRLPAAYRSLPRPSSPLSAQASTIYPSLLSSAFSRHFHRR